MKTRKCLAILGSLCLLAGAASAEWERTISAWDTRLPAEGKLQLSLWGGYWEWEQGQADASAVDATLYVNYGLADNWSATVAPGLSFVDVDGGSSESGIADTSLLTTYRFLDEAGDGFDAALMGSLLLPTGDDDKGLGTGHVEPGLRLLASKTLGPVIAVANAGAVLIPDADDGEEDFLLQAALEGIVPVSEKLSLNAVLSATTARWDGADDEVDLGIGARLNPDERFFVLGAVYACLTDAYDWGLQLAAGFEF